MSDTIYSDGLVDVSEPYEVQNTASNSENGLHPGMIDDTILGMQYHLSLIHVAGTPREACPLNPPFCVVR